MKSLKLAVVAISLIGIFGVGNAMAVGNATGTVDVSATVLATCAFDSANATMAFDDIDPTSGATYLKSATIGFICTNGLPWDFSDVGTTDKALGAGGLQYSVASATPSGTGSGIRQTVTIDGSIAPGQYKDALDGSYTDEYTVKINF